MTWWTTHSTASCFLHYFLRILAQGAPHTAGAQHFTSVGIPLDEMKDSYS